MGKKSSPAPPDYEGLAERTAEASREATTRQSWDNRVDQYNPWGSVTWDNELAIDPATGQQITKWTQNVDLTPEQLAALQSQMNVGRGRSELAESMLGDISQDFGERMDFDQYGDPIGMDPMDRLGGAGEGIRQDFSAGGLGNVDARVRSKFDFDDPGLEGQTLQDRLDYSGAPDVNAPEWTRQAAEQSVYDRGASRLDPQIAQEAQALEVKLRSQGLNPGDEAYEAQMNAFNQRKTDAYDALSAQAMQEGARQAESMFGMESQYRDQSTGEQDRMGQFRNQALQGQFGIDAQRQAQMYDIARGIGEFGQNADMARLQALMQGRGQDVQQNALGLQAQGMGNQAQQQAFNQLMQQAGYNQNLGFRENQLANMLRTQQMGEDTQQRAFRLNELNSLLTGQQVQAPQFQGYNQAQRAQSADYLGAGDMQFQADMAKHGADQAMMNSLMSGLGQGAGMFASMSDRRLKKNIRKIAQHKGVNWYEYDYVWGEHAVGVMADEVPWAAFDTPSGFKAVDYGRIY